MVKPLSRQNKVAHSIHIVCGFIFVVYSVLFLLYQSHLLEILQKVLSGGQTAYSPLWGTIIITVLLCLLQMGMYRLFSLSEHLYALSYLPSIMLLVWLTDFDVRIYHQNLWSKGIWLFLGSIGLLWLLSRLDQRIERRWVTTADTSWTERCWPNLLLLLLLCWCPLYLSNAQRSFHYETAVDAAIIDSNYRKALQIASDTRYASRELSVLRAYALSRLDSLPHRLFAYPQLYGSKGLLFEAGEPRTTWLTSDEIYHYLGNHPLEGESVVAFLYRSCHTGTGSARILDYYLCALLLRKDLDLFVDELSEFCYVDDSSPRAYLEALYLYYIYHPSAEKLLDMTAMEQIYRNYRLSPTNHQDTYWYYYDYTRIYFSE